MTAYKLEKHWYPPQHTVSRVLMLIGHVPLFYMQGHLNIQCMTVPLTPDLCNPISKYCSCTASTNYYKVEDLFAEISI